MESLADIAGINGAASAGGFSEILIAYLMPVMIIGIFASVAIGVVAGLKK